MFKSIYRNKLTVINVKLNALKYLHKSDPSEYRRLVELREKYFKKLYKSID